MEFRNIFRHLHLVNKHRFYVFKNCVKAGIIWQGLTHDLSKYSPTEFFESVQYFNGEISPIDVCKREKGYSNAWLHHKGRNKHHYEYWQDNFDKGGTPLKMPYKYALEMVCDYLGAGQAYYGVKRLNKTFYKDEYAWWKIKKSNPLAMNLHTKLFIELMLSTMAKEGNNDCLRQVRSTFYYKLAYTLTKEVSDNEIC